MKPDSKLSAAEPTSYGATTLEEMTSPARKMKDTLKTGSLASTSATGFGAVPTVCWLILVVELCERLAYYTLTGTQAFFLEHMGFSLAEAGGLNSTMWTLCSLWALGASWVADSVLGRFHTILASGSLYTLAALLIGLAASPGNENISLYQVATMILLPIATAGIKANISNFGADQYDTSTAEGKAAQEHFFSYFYFCINIGAGIAYGFVTTFASSGGLGVKQQNGYMVSYMAMGVFMGIATMVFFSGRSRYETRPIQESSALTRTICSLRDTALGVGTAGSAAERRSAAGPALMVILGIIFCLIGIILSVVSSLAPGTGYLPKVVCAFAIVGTGLVVFPCQDPWWINLGDTTGVDEEGAPIRASDDAAFGCDRVEVAAFLKILPTLFTGTLAFSSLYNSMQFWYQQQACQMDVLMGRSIMLSGSFFNLADCLAIIIMTPLVVGYFNPFLERILHSPLGTVTKYKIGMAVGLVSVLIASYLERLRRTTGQMTLGSDCSPKGVLMSDISAVWMALPYFLMGIGEIYCYVTLMHYSYSVAPPSMQCLSSAAFFFVQSVSSGIFTVIVNAMTPYIPDDLNNGHLEYGYLVNIVIGVFFFLAFLHVFPQ